MNMKLILGVVISGIGGLVVETMDFRTILYGFCMVSGGLLVRDGLDESR